MKDYDREIAKFQIGVYQQQIEDTHYLSDKNDKILVWVVGLSAGSIALLFSNIKSLQFVSPIIVNITMLLLVLTILLGVVARVLDHKVSKISIRSMRLFLQDMEMLSRFDKPREISGKESYLEMIQILREDFDDDAAYVIEEIKKDKPTLSKEEITKMLHEYYRHLTKYSKNEETRVFDKIFKSYKTHNGYTEDDWMNEMKNKPTKRVVVKRMDSLARLLFSASAFCFVLAVVVFVLAYMFK